MRKHYGWRRRSGEMERERPRIGLALGAGGIRACAHIGVLKVLVDEGIPIHCVAGASAGALIGAGFAGGMTPQDIEDTFMDLSFRDYLRFYTDRIRVRRSSGVGRKILDLSGSLRLEDLPVPCALVAVDLLRKERVILRGGPAQTAVRASIAIPFVSGPVRVNGRRLYDGGLIDPVPVDLPRLMGAEKVISVDVGTAILGMGLGRIGALLKKVPALREAGNLLELMGGMVPRYSDVPADLQLRPDLRGIGPNSIRRASIRRAIAQGQACAVAALPSISQLASGA